MSEDPAAATNSPTPIALPATPVAARPDAARTSAFIHLRVNIKDLFLRTNVFCSLVHADARARVAQPRMNVAAAVADWLKGVQLLHDDECEGPTGDTSRVTLSHSVSCERPA